MGGGEGEADGTWKLTLAGGIVMVVGVGIINACDSASGPGTEAGRGNGEGAIAETAADVGYVPACIERPRTPEAGLQQDAEDLVSRSQPTN